MARGLKQVKQKPTATDLRDFQAMAWAFMASISDVLSEHPVAKSERRYRARVDEARKALFDLHGAIGRPESGPRSSARLSRAYSIAAESVAEKVVLARWVGTPAGGLPDIIEERDARQRFGRIMKDTFNDQPQLIRRPGVGLALITRIDDIVREVTLEVMPVLAGIELPVEKSGTAREGRSKAKYGRSRATPSKI